MAQHTQAPIIWTVQFLLLLVYKNCDWVGITSCSYNSLKSLRSASTPKPIVATSSSFTTMSSTQWGLSVFCSIDSFLILLLSILNFLIISGVCVAAKVFFVVVYLRAFSSLYRMSRYFIHLFLTLLVSSNKWPMPQTSRRLRHSTHEGHTNILTL